MQRVKLETPNRSKTKEEKALVLRHSGAGHEVALAPMPDGKRPLAMGDVGAKDTDYLSGIVAQMSNAVKSDLDLKFAFSFIKDFKPRDQLEGTLAAQMSVVHINIMHFAWRLSNARDSNELSVCETIFTKLCRTFLSQAETLKRYRATNESGPTVQNVSVQDGGQAIVGHVTHNAPAALPEKIARAPLVIEDRKRAPMPPVGAQEADPDPQRSDDNG